jgi:hypothetical protein
VPAYRTRGEGAANSGVPNRLHSRRTTSAALQNSAMLRGRRSRLAGSVQLKTTKGMPALPMPKLKHVSHVWVMCRVPNYRLLKRIRSFSVAPDWIANAKTLMSSPAFWVKQVRMARPLFNRPSNPQEPCQTNLTFCAIEYFPRLTPVRPTLTLTSEFSAATSHSSSTFWADPIQDV